MQRFTVIVTMAALIVASGLAGARFGGTTAQESDGAATIHGAVGAWRVTTFVDGAPPAPNMTTFYADGNVLTSNRPVFPAAAGGGAGEARSAGHGTWVAVDDHTVDFTFEVLLANTDGTPAGARTIAGRLTLGEDSLTWSGPFTATVTDVAGAVTAIVAGRTESSRILVQPMAEGAATPSA